MGVGDVFSSKTTNFWGQPNCSVTLFEPNLFLYKSLFNKVKNISNIKLHNIAIYNESRLGKLVHAGVLSYLPEVMSPINRIFKGRLTEALETFVIPVNLMTFDEFDGGDIDILQLGMEGAEFTVFEKMKSRPHVIYLHNYFANDYKYTFPNWDYISHWIKNNDYEIINGIPTVTLVNRKSYSSGLISIKQ